MSPFESCPIAITRLIFHCPSLRAVVHFNFNLMRKLEWKFNYSCKLLVKDFLPYQQKNLLFRKKGIFMKNKKWSILKCLEPSSVWLEGTKKKNHLNWKPDKINWFSSTFFLLFLLQRMLHFQVWVLKAIEWKTGRQWCIFALCNFRLFPSTN